MSKVLTAKDVEELFRKAPRYMVYRSEVSRSPSLDATIVCRSRKPKSVKLLCAQKRAEGKSYALIARELRARRIPIDRETVSKILREPEIARALEGEFEIGIEGIKEDIRQEFAKRRIEHEQREAERQRRLAIQDDKDRKRARERWRKLKELEQAALSDSYKDLRVDDSKEPWPSLVSCVPIARGNT
jgi:hypothetical protein